MLQRCVISAQAKIESIGVVFTFVCGNARNGQLGVDPLIDVVIGGRSILGNFKALDGKQVIQVASGKYHCIALIAGGDIYTWGDNRHKQLGVELPEGVTFTPEIQPLRSLNLKKVIQIAAGASHSMVLTESGEVYSWGMGAIGSLGLGGGKDNTKDVSIPTKISSFDSLSSKVIQIACGFYHSGAVTEKGELFMWGHGEFGCLGSKQSSHIPFLLPLNNVRMISLGWFSSAAVTSDGLLYTWGSNKYKLLGVELAMATSNVPIAVATFAAKRIAVWKVVFGKSIAAAIDVNGKLYTWGTGPKAEYSQKKVINTEKEKKRKKRSLR